MSHSSLQSDIDYMKSLAVAGGVGPLNNGGTLFWAGLLYSIAAICQYGIIRGWLPQTLVMNMIVWFGASALFAIIAVILRRRCDQIPGSATSRAANSAWSAVGLGIIAFIVVTLIVANITSDAGALYFVIAPVVLIMYGMGWWVSAKMSGMGWLKFVAAGCFAGAPLMGFLSGRPEQLLAYAALLILLAAMPGFILTRAARA